MKVMHKMLLLQVLQRFVNLISILVICFKFIFTAMLDKLITYTVCWYKTSYQVLSVMWLVVILVHTTILTWYTVMYVIGIYRSVWCQAYYDITDKSLTSVLKVLPYITTSIRACSITRVEILMIMSFSTFKTADTLYMTHLKQYRQ